MPMTRCLFVFMVAVLYGSTLCAQQLKLGKNPYAVEKSAVLELLSDNQGLLFPRIADTTAINALIPPDGMVIFFTGTKQLLVRTNGYWQPVLFAAALGNNYWSVNGNTNGSIKTLGTSDNYALPFITNGTERMRITNDGKLGIGNTAPTEVVDVTGNMKFSGALMPGNNAGTSGYLLTSAGTGTTPTWTNPSTLISSSAWSLGGNGVAAVTNFGTTTAFDLPFITNNTEKMRITSGGRLGIGNTAPTEILDVTGNMKFSGALMPGNNAGTSGYLLTSAGTGTTPTWTNPSTLISSSAWSLGGNGVAAVTNFGTTTAFDLPFITNNTEKMRITSAGRLGIGNTTPTEVLDVTGNMKFSGALMPGNNAGTSGYLLTSAGTGTTPTWTNPSTLISSTAWSLGGNGVAAVTNFGTTTAFDLPFITNNTEKMRITSAGRLGIGNTTPTEILDVTGNMKFSGALMPGNNAGTSGYLLTSAGTGTTPTWTNPSTLIGSSAWSLGGNNVAAVTNIGTTSAFALPFITGNTERMRIAANGYVGIGVTNPSNPLVVRDTLEIRRVGSVSELLFTNTITSGDFRIGDDGTNNFWQSGGGRNLQMGAYYGIILTGDRQASGFPAFATGTSGTGVLISSQRNASIPLAVQANSASQSGNLTEWRNNSGTAISAVNSAGRLGLGNSAPSEVLDVTGNMKFSGALMPGNNAGTSGYLLTSAGTGTTPTWTNPSTLIGSSAWSLGGNGVAAVTNIGTTTAFDLPFITNNTEKMRITSAGRLGLGNTTPTEILDVTGNMKFSGALMPGNNAGTSGYLLTSAGTGTTPTWTNPSTLISSAAWSLGGNGVAAVTNFGTTTAFDLPFITNNTEKMRITSAGRLGIGNTTPTEILDVTGNMKFSGALMPGNNAGTSGYLLTSAGTGTTPTWTNPSTLIGSSAWSLGGNGVAAVTNFGTTTAFDLPFITGNTERMRITSSGNIGIGTTTAQAPLDVNGNFKAGAKGTVEKNIVSFANTLSTTAVAAGTGGTIIVGGVVTYSAVATDVTVTIPSSANYLTSTQATVTVSPGFDLPAGVSIAYARLTSTSQVKIRFINASTTAQSISGALYITITEF